MTDLTQPHVHEHVPSETKSTQLGESNSTDLLVCDIIDEFTPSIPSYVDKMPAFNSNGVTRNEQEWKHLTFAMAKEIIRLRKAH